jgi:hypothetical protein
MQGGERLHLFAAEKQFKEDNNRKERNHQKPEEKGDLACGFLPAPLVGRRAASV